MPDVEVVTTDILVVGGGAAAAAAAIEAADRAESSASFGKGRGSGPRVMVVDRGKFCGSGSSMTSGGGFTVLLPPEKGGHPKDNLDAFLEDALSGGAYLGDPSALRMLGREAESCLRDVESFGVPFEKDAAGKYVVRRMLGQSFPRSVRAVPARGSTLLTGLRKEALRRDVRVVENTMVLRLLCGDDSVEGALGLNVRTGGLMVIHARAIVLAVGSATGLYPFSSASLTTTGDGYALAYDAGANLTNMEFVEFTVAPIGHGRPISTGGIKPVTAAGATWVNANGEPFMRRYDSRRGDLTDRTTIVQANCLERRAGRGPVFLDFSTIPPDQMQLLEEQGLGILRKLRSAGVDYWSEKVECAPAAHTFLGGIEVGEGGESSVAGLFAAGESAGFGGMFGAGRAGSGLMACLVFGKRAGRSAAEFACSAPDPLASDASILAAIGELESSRVRDGADGAYERRRVQDLALECLNVIRDSRGLRRAVEGFAQVRELRLAAGDVPGLVAALEVRNLALTGEMVARAALMREESRGQHLREDFQLTDNLDWLKRIVISKRAGGMNLETVPLPYASSPADSALLPPRDRSLNPVFQAVNLE